MAPLAGKHVLVIGGSSGIGFGVARIALNEGARVTIASSSEAKVRAAVERLGGGDKVAAEVVNAREESEVKALFERVGSIDHLVFTVRNYTFEDLLIALTTAIVLPGGRANSGRGHRYYQNRHCCTQAADGSSLLW